MKTTFTRFYAFARIFLEIVTIYFSVALSMIPYISGALNSLLVYTEAPFAAYFILAIPAELLWRKYIEQTYLSQLQALM